MKWTDPPIPPAKLCEAIQEQFADALATQQSEALRILQALPLPEAATIIVRTSCPEDEMRWMVSGVTIAAMKIDPADMPPADDSLEERINEAAQRYYRKVHP